MASITDLFLLTNLCQSTLSMLSCFRTWEQMKCEKLFWQQMTGISIQILHALRRSDSRHPGDYGIGKPEIRLNFVVREIEKMANEGAIIPMAG